ncbi:MAG: hypothetical protein IJS68_03810 [Clostridia bacterium]|nr:hypothetical protein [Clostridia bacterium]
MIRFLKRKGWIIVLVLFLMLFPQSLSSQARLNNRVLITGLAIDKTAGTYSVTAQVAMPIAGGEGKPSASFEFVTDSGKTITEALNKTGYKIGKIAGLSHTNFIMLGAGVMEDNLIDDLDYFVRDAHLPNSVMIVACEGSAEEEIKKTKSLELPVGLALQKVYLFKQDALNSIMVPAHRFVDMAYEPSKVSVVPTIKIEDSGEGGGQGGQSQGEEKTARLEYITPIKYFKNGVYVDELAGKDEVFAYLVAQSFGKSFDMVVNNVDDRSMFFNAEVGLRVGKKATKTSIDFSGFAPKAKITIDLKDILLLEVNNENGNPSGLLTNSTYVNNQTLNEAIKGQISEKIQQVFDKTKQQNVDLFGFINHAYRFNYGDYKKYIQYNVGEDAFLQNLELEVEVRVGNYK